MARPRIFLSSTFYDLKQIRADLDNFIVGLGYDVVRNEEGDIPYGKEEALEEYCYKEIKSSDILVSIIGGRFGSTSQKDNSSISQIELRTALKENKQIYIFIEKSVLFEYETYLLNKDSDNGIKYKYVDDIRVYQFIEEIKNLNSNNNIKSFETVSDITIYLKEQFAGLFQRFLNEQTRVKEVNLIFNLEKTAQTLNKLVNYLSDENKGQTEEINRILMINHPLIEDLREKLSIPYNFYIEGIYDMKQLIQARGFKELDIFPWDTDYTYEKILDREGKKMVLTISETIFDDDKKLKFIKKNDWDKKSVVLNYVDLPKDKDDLPF